MVGSYKKSKKNFFHKELIDKIYDLIASVLVFVRAENHLFSLDLRRSWLHISVIGLLSHTLWSTESHQNI